MKKKVPVVTVAEAKEAARIAGMPLEASVALADVASAVKEGLMAFVSSTGLMVLHQLLEAEMPARIGPKHAKRPEREANWHGTTTGPLTLGGRKVNHISVDHYSLEEGDNVSPTLESSGVPEGMAELVVL